MTEVRSRSRSQRKSTRKRASGWDQGPLPGQTPALTGLALAGLGAGAASNPAQVSIQAAQQAALLAAQRLQSSGLGGGSLSGLQSLGALGSGLSSLSSLSGLGGGGAGLGALGGLGGLAGLGALGANPTSLSGMSQRLVQIPQPKVGRIIGKGGETVKQLEQMTGAVIKMDQSTQAQGHSLVVIHSANPEVLDQAERLVKQLIETGGGTAMPQPGMLTETIKIPGGACGKFVGLKGANIRRMQEESGAKIELDQGPRESEGYCNVIVHASDSDTLERGRALVHQVVGEDIARMEGRGPAPMAQAAPMPQAIADVPQQHPKEAYPVPPDACGRLIGKGGQVIRGIVEEARQLGGFMRLDTSDAQQPMLLMEGPPEALELIKARVDPIVPGTFGEWRPQGQEDWGWQGQADDWSGDWWPEPEAWIKGKAKGKMMEMLMPGKGGGNAWLMPPPSGKSGKGKGQEAGMGKGKGLPAAGFGARPGAGLGGGLGAGSAGAVSRFAAVGAGAGFGAGSAASRFGAGSASFGVKSAGVGAGFGAGSAPAGAGFGAGSAGASAGANDWDQGDWGQEQDWNGNDDWGDWSLPAPSAGPVPPVPLRGKGAGLPAPAPAPAAAEIYDPAAAPAASDWDWGAGGDDWSGW